jgi:hypothetical protein
MLLNPPREVVLNNYIRLKLGGNDKREGVLTPPATKALDKRPWKTNLEMKKVVFQTFAS